MEPTVVFLSIPGLRPQDLESMPRLDQLAAERASLAASFPCVTWPVQANMITGRLPNEHGIVSNGLFWRDRQVVEMWTAPNQVIQSTQIWDELHKRDDNTRSAVWFPMLSKRSTADYVCMPAPVHNPDGSESLWCYTQPQDFYGTLREQLGDFPLQHFWGPLAGIASTSWIVRSAVIAARQFRPRFFFLYLPHLDYAAQRDGPDSEAAIRALGELDGAIGELADGLRDAYGTASITWLAASEYVITEVDHVCYPNRLLREAGYLQTQMLDGAEELDLGRSSAWALVDHQFSHVFVRDPGDGMIEQVTRLFTGRPGIAEVLAGDEKSKYGLDHSRSGEIVLVSEPNSWQAYYWWFDDSLAPRYARSVDIHRKPGYDPVELHFDPATKSIPLDARLVRGSHGAPVVHEWQRGLLMSSESKLLPAQQMRDVDVFDVIRGCYGIP